MELISAVEVCRRADVPYRVIDYWTRCGTLTPTVPADGSGSRRAYDAAMVPAIGNAHRISRGLDAAGVHRRGQISIAVIRELIDAYWQGIYQVAPGVWLTWVVDVEQAA